MKEDLLQSPEYYPLDQTFLYSYSFGNENEQQKFLERLKRMFDLYSSNQDIISLKYALHQNFRIAKIGQVIIKNNQVQVAYYYENTNKDKIHIHYNKSENDKGACEQGYELSKHYDKEFSNLDIPTTKQLVIDLIESIHSAANFGFFFDTHPKLLLIVQGEGNLFILLPSFTLITLFYQNSNCLTFEHIEQFRRKHFSNITCLFFKKFMKQFEHMIKQQDEDIEFYRDVAKIKIPDNLCYDSQSIFGSQEILKGVDQFYSENLVKKKMIRRSLKQTLILYQLDTDQEARNMLYQAIIKSQQTAELQNNINNSQNSNTNFDILSKSKETINFLKQFKLQYGEGNEILTPLLEKLQEYLKQKEEYKEQYNCIQWLVHPFWKKTQTQIFFDVKETQEIQNNETLSFEAKLYSLIHSNNLIFPNCTQSAQLIQKDQKKLGINFKFEMLEEKQCYIIKTQIPEIIFAVDTADDITFLINIIQKEEIPTNLYIDDQRKVTIYTSIVHGSHQELIQDIVKIIDTHVIFFYVLIDFYYKNIQQGKQNKEEKYKSFVQELLHYLNDYNQDFEIQLEQIMQNKVKSGF